jgi:outer membrane protein TolC
MSLLAFIHLSQAEEKLTLGQFLEKVETSNIDLKIEQVKTEASEAQSSTIGLPPPMVSLSFLREKEGSSATGFEINQTIPFPGRITKDKTARNLEAESQKEMAQARKSEIIAEAKQTYFEYWGAYKKLEILQGKKIILKDHLKLARAGIRSDSTMKIHFLKTESDFDLLENDIEIATQNLEEMRLKLSVFLGQPSSEKIPDPVEPALSQMTNPVYQNSSPAQLKASELELRMFHARESEAHQAWFPDLTLRYKEMGATQMMPQYSEVMVGMSLPFLFPWEASAISKKSTAERLAAEFRLEKLKKEISSLRSVAWSRALSLKKQLAIFEEKLLPRAHKRMQLIHNIAPRDMESLQDHRETMEAMSDLELKALETRLAYEKSLAELEKWDAKTGE